MVAEPGKLPAVQLKCCVTRYRHSVTRQALAWGLTPNGLGMCVSWQGTAYAQLCTGRYDMCTERQQHVSATVLVVCVCMCVSDFLLQGDFG
jgi:hypothetical protein